MLFNAFGVSFCAILLILPVHTTILTTTRKIKACNTHNATGMIIYKTSVYLQISENVPSNLDTIASFSNLLTDSQTPEPSLSPLLSISDTTPFILAVGGGRSGQNGEHMRRQSFSYVGLSGRTSTDCSSAATFSLVNGQLSYTNSSGTMIFGALSSALTSYVLFVPSTNPGDITTTFSLGQGGTLMWSSLSFPAISASFCVRNDGSILAVFVIGTQPTDCVFTAITIADLTTCPQGFAAVSGPSGPSGEYPFHAKSPFTDVF
jgi:hypothetical protein